MDPLSVLSIAAAVAQFLDFTAGVISVSSGIFRSAKGAAADNLALEAVCSNLVALGDQLDLAIDARGVSHSARGLKQLSAQCKSDCTELLALLDRVKVQVGSAGPQRLWKSIKAGLGTAWNARVIQDFGKRLERTQRLMILYIGSFVSDQVASLDDTLRAMDQESTRMQIDQSSKLDLISKGLQDLKLDIFPQVEADTGNSNAPRMLHHVAPVDMIEELSSRLKSLSGAQSDLAKEHAILSSLNFQSRRVRHEGIAEAHARTLRWVFTSVLSDWLHTGSGIFWVSGRAGSGKSTLTKFLADEPRTREALAQWAEPKPAVIVAHYFWSAGTPMQRSQHGLLQSLLYDIFRKSPECIRLICPSQWNDASSKVRDTSTEPWSFSELNAALSALAAHESLPAKFCFIIDGLDEFEGDHFDICVALSSLARSPNFKLCVSSRPLNVFEDAFCSCRQLSVHDFTWDDIANFAQDRLEEHPKWAARAEEADKRQSLIHDIIERAEGVFLWVFLVVKSLRDGLNNDDNIDELQKRLESLPTRLESLFKHMLNSVDPIYHEKMAGNLLMTMYTDMLLPIDIYGYHDNEYRDPDYAIKWPVGLLSAFETAKFLSRTRRRINARSNGLLEVRIDHVQFLHRSVRDFLRTEDMHNYLAAKAPLQFNAAHSVARAQVAMIKSWHFTGDAIGDRTEERSRRMYGSRVSSVDRYEGFNGGQIISRIDECFMHASRVRKENQERVAELLDELERGVEEMFLKGQAAFQCRECPPRLLVREQALLSMCHPYVARKLGLTRPSDYFNIFIAPPLYVTTRFTVTAAPANAMIPLLLEHGLDPNERSTEIPESTPWLALVCCLHSVWEARVAVINAAMRAGVFSAFLAKNANPNAVLPSGSVTAFGLYLLASLTQTSFFRVSEAYLRTMDDFLDAGADPFAPLSTSIISTMMARKGFLSLHVIAARSESLPTVEPTLDVFCRSVGLIRERTREKREPGSIKLVLSVIEKLISRGFFDEKSYALKLMTAIRDSQEVFPAATMQRLTNMLFERGVPAADPDEASGLGQRGASPNMICRISSPLWFR
ncbi:hypothetical protein B0T19DRAFT_455639 [Cercophora scortea]|uniref:NACHT domain-containing protein n=1 Tax=Cercophora scortea TaxID=314031 RepID=A0AAE0J698_9PEZI|nr:hypothetical protein B0T19DRAFT_455639 [Cercophora scortea]